MQKEKKWKRPMLPLQLKFEESANIVVSRAKMGGFFIVKVGQPWQHVWEVHFHGDIPVFRLIKITSEYARQINAIIAEIRNSFSEKIVGQIHCRKPWPEKAHSEKYRLR